MLGLRVAAVGLRAEPGGAFLGDPAKNSRGWSLYRWHWHLVAGPRVPNTLCRSSQLASLAGTTETTDPGVVMRAILQVESAVSGCCPWAACWDGFPRKRPQAAP